MRTPISLALKDLRLLTRDGMALFWVLGFPVVFAVFFGSIMKVGVAAEQPRVPIALVGAAPGEVESAHIALLADALASAGLAVQVLPLTQAQAAVRRGDVAALIDVPPPTQLVPIQIAFDPARRSEAMLASSLLQLVLNRALSQQPVALPPLEMVALAGTQSAIGPASGFVLVFPMMIVWGLLGCAAAFSVALVSERVSGTLLRLYAAPISRAQIVAGKALACALACASSVLVLSAIGVLALAVPIEDGLKYLAASLGATTCFVGIAQALSVLGKTEQSVAGAGWSTLIVLAMCGGAMVPQLLMPPWLVTLSAWSPVRWAIVALEGAMWRAAPWSELLAPVLGLCAVGVACFAIAAQTLRMREA